MCRDFLRLDTEATARLEEYHHTAPNLIILSNQHFCNINFVTRYKIFLASLIFTCARAKKAAFSRSGSKLTGCSGRQEEAGIIEVFDDLPQVDEAVLLCLMFLLHDWRLAIEDSFFVN